MAFGKHFFPPQRRALWSEVSRELGAEFIRGGVWKSDRIVARLQQWEIVMDTYTVHTGQVMMEYTRFRAPFVSTDGIRFRVFRKGFWNWLRLLFGRSDIQVGVPEFDDAFVIHGNRPETLSRFFANAEIRNLLSVHKRFDFKILDDEGWLGSKFPRGVDELYFEVSGTMRDKQLIKAVFSLLSVSLQQLVAIGSAQTAATGVVLK